MVTCLNDEEQQATGPKATVTKTQTSLVCRAIKALDSSFLCLVECFHVLVSLIRTSKRSNMNIAHL